ncbi:MAG: hypothetical protein FH753_18570 [Firmicutes bacterium]|nr:hypothetical protein [Bacillota bacterium]
MNYNQIEKIMLSYNLIKYEISEGTNFKFLKGNRHRVILERLRPLKKGGASGFLYVEVLDKYKDSCSKNGHINVKEISSEVELRNIVENLISYFEEKYGY